MKIVIDTNVIIDGIKDDYSYEKQILDAVINGEIEAYANHQTLSENKLIMNQLVNDQSYKNEIYALFSQINLVTNRHQIHIVRDPEDNKILESAVEAKVDYLITRDKELLALDDFQNIKVVTPDHFWNAYKDSGGELWKQWAGFFGKE